MTLEHLEKLRTQLALMTEVGIAGDAEREMIGLLAYVDELRRDAEAMASNWAHADGDGLVSCWFCCHCDDMMRDVAHAPDCLALKYGAAKMTEGK